MYRVSGNKCPECDKTVFNRNKFKELYNGVLMFGSVHTKCPECDTEIVCGCLNQEKREFVIITEEKYNEIIKKNKNDNTKG